MPLDPELVEILACPQCKGGLRLAPSGEGLICDRCRLRYPIEDDIPQLLVEEAERLDAPA